jgi:hypothetical protein
MSVVLIADVVSLRGDCGIEDVEPLLKIIRGAETGAGSVADDPARRVGSNLAGLQGSSDWASH